MLKIPPISKGLNMKESASLQSSLGSFLRLIEDYIKKTEAHALRKWLGFRRVRGGYITKSIVIMYIQFIIYTKPSFSCNKINNALSHFVVLAILENVVGQRYAEHLV